ncbi:MAG: efflux RND transporter periplasmic adaptor subunit [Candidatus Marinimicrobia bacterium]|nr:efflux RND transporter periplasmic adaptor subunit [Candidatus Neomarinimicrobiota bacterium]
MLRKTIYIIVGIIVILGGFGYYSAVNDHEETINAVPDNEDQKQDERKIKYWVAPMDPNFISDRPGKSPMGMDLVPVYEDKSGGSESVIIIDPTVVQNTGIMTTPVEIRSIFKEIRTIGLVDYDETRYTHIHTKVKGWIERLYVNFTGQRVKKNQALLDIYSPELVSTQEEYLSALSSLTTSSVGSEALLRSTRDRLSNWDITSEQIDKLERTGKVSKVMTLYSPFNGIVVEKKALAGMSVVEGMNLYAIADLSKVWVYADIYEFELPWLEEQQEAEMTLTYIPGKKFKGKVAYIYPYLDSKTRTIKVRLEFDNENGELKPGMYANIVIKAAERKNSIVIPKESVIHSGERDIVFISYGKGKFEPREVTLGVSGEGGYYEVLDGLTGNEMVVTSGQFMLDSESSLREAVRKRLRAMKRKSNDENMNMEME